MAEKQNILFLDFDGVLNSRRSFWKKFAEHFGVEWKEEDFDIDKWYGKGHMENMNPDLWDKIDRAEQESKGKIEFPDLGMYNWPHEEPAIEALNKIVADNEAKVVVISSWRTGRSIKELQEILDKWGAECEVIDKTIHLNKDYNTRGYEILEWVMQNRKIIKGICILDDDSEYDINAIFKKWAVQDISMAKHGLRDIHVPVAEKCFLIPIRPLYDFDKWLPKDMLEEARKEDGEKPPSEWKEYHNPLRGTMDSESWGDPPDWRDTGEMGG